MGILVSVPSRTSCEAGPLCGQCPLQAEEAKPGLIALQLQGPCSHPRGREAGLFPHLRAWRDMAGTLAGGGSVAPERVPSPS